MTDFKTRFGFERGDVNISNWRSHPFSQWSFQNFREMVPTSAISCMQELGETELASSPFLDEPLQTGLAEAATPRAFLDYAHTDAFVLMKSGRIVAEHYAPHAGVNEKHIVFSISKSLTAILCGILEAQGVVDPACPVADYLPEAKNSAYADCSVRDVLDMRVSLDFEEAYLDKTGAFARYRRSTLWNPAETGLATETLQEFLMNMKKADRPHGGRFFYASPNSDLLGLLIERASGKRYADLFSELLWKPLGARNHAFISVDGAGTARAAGGVCVTARDLARVGQLLLDDGVSAITGQQVIPAEWILDMRKAGDAEAWRQAKPTFLPNGRYRSQWYQSGEADGAFCAIGIHGQWLYVDPSSQTVIVKLSSQPNPLDDELKQDNFAFFRAVSNATI